MVDATSAHSSPQSDRITYVVRLPDGTEFGPLPAAEVRSLVKQRTIPPGAFLRRADGKHWRLISDLFSPDEFGADGNAQSTSQAEPRQHAAGAAAPPVAPSFMSPETYGAAPTGHASPLPAAPRQVKSHSSTHDASKLADVLGPVVVIAVGVPLFVGFFWLINHYRLNPLLVRGIVKFFLLAVPAAAGGLWALGKASERSR